MIQLYYGDGKGKTTAAVGLAVRAAGHGMKVLFCQCMKDGTSSEVQMLKKLGIDYCCCTEKFGFFWNMKKEQREAAAKAYRALFERAAGEAQNGAFLLVMDELIAAYNHELVDRERVLAFLRGKPEGLEIVLTGREPAPELLDLADYVSEIRKRKHPFEQGIAAREGIEF